MECFEVSLYFEDCLPSPNLIFFFYSANAMPLLTFFSSCRDVNLLSLLPPYALNGPPEDIFRLSCSRLFPEPRATFAGLGHFLPFKSAVFAPPLFFL